MELPVVSPELAAFGNRFVFDHKRHLHARIVREAYCTAYYECIKSSLVLLKYNSSRHVRGGRSEYDIEIVSGPCPIEQVGREVKGNDWDARAYHAVHVPILSESAWKDDRYLGHGLAFTRIEIFTAGHQNLLRAYNNAVRYAGTLLSRREAVPLLERYKEVFPDCLPKTYGSWKQFHQDAVERGFETRIDSCQSLIRMTSEGAVEFRIFEPTRSIDTIVGWAYLCHALCTIG